MSNDHASQRGPAPFGLPAPNWCRHGLGARFHPAARGRGLLRRCGGAGLVRSRCSDRKPPRNALNSKASARSLLLMRCCFVLAVSTGAGPATSERWDTSLLRSTAGSTSSFGTLHWIQQPRHAQMSSSAPKSARGGAFQDAADSPTRLLPHAVHGGRLPSGRLWVLWGAEDAGGREVAPPLVDRTMCRAMVRPACPGPCVLVSGCTAVYRGHSSWHCVRLTRRRAVRSCRRRA